MTRQTTKPPQPRKSAAARIEAAETSERAGRWQEAAGFWARALRTQQGPLLSYRYADALAESGDLAKAERVYRAAIRKYPGDSRAYFGLGVLLKDVGRLADARKVLLGGLKARTSQPILTILGFVERRLDLTKEAEKTLRHSLELKPDDDEARVQLGYLIRNQRPHEAVIHYRAALQIEPRFPRAHRELGWALWRCKRLKQAEAALRKAIRLDAGDAWAHNYLGGLLAIRGAWKEARAVLQVAVYAEPKFGPFWADLAEASGKLGLDQQAEREFKQALRLGLDSAVSTWKYGVFLVRRGRRQSARRYLARALQLDPSYDVARRWIEHLDRLEAGRRGQP